MLVHSRPSRLTIFRDQTSLGLIVLIRDIFYNTHFVVSSNLAKLIGARNLHLFLDESEYEEVHADFLNKIPNISSIYKEIPEEGLILISTPGLCELLLKLKHPKAAILKKELLGSELIQFNYQKSVKPMQNQELFLLNYIRDNDL